MWKSFVSFFRDTSSIWYQHKEFGGTKSTISPFLDLSMIFNRRLQEHGGAEQSYSRMSLEDVMTVCKERRYADVRDRWYGCMGMLEIGQYFRVDYGIKPTELLLNVIETLVATTDPSLYTIWSIAHALSSTLNPFCADCALEHGLGDDSALSSTSFPHHHQYINPPFVILSADANKTIRTFPNTPGVPTAQRLMMPAKKECAICGHRLLFDEEHLSVLTDRRTEKQQQLLVFLERSTEEGFCAGSRCIKKHFLECGK